MRIEFTWSDLYDLARLYADERVEGTIDNTEISKIALVAGRKVQSRVIARGGADFFRSEVTGTLDASTLTLSNPADPIEHFQLEWTATDIEVVRPIEQKEIPRYSTLTWGRCTPKGYTINKNTSSIVFYPSVSGSVTYRFWQITTLSFSTTRGPAGFDEAIALETAIMMRAIQDKPTQELRRQLAEAYKAMDLAITATRPEPLRVIDEAPEGVVYSEFYLPRA